MEKKSKGKKKRRLSLVGFSIVFFTFALGSWLVTSLLVNTINTNLTIKIQTMTDELDLIRSQNQTLNYEIQNLENKDRVYAVAQAADLDQVSDNIISINIGE